MISTLMAWYEKLGPHWQTRMRRWVVRPAKRLLSYGVIRQEGFVLARRLDQSVCFRLWREKHYEPALSNLLRQQLEPGDVFFDIGANIGYFTLLGAACVGSRGQVHSFEPNPEPYRALRHNIEINRFQHVTANAVALSEQPGSARLWLNNEIDSGLASFGKTGTLLDKALTCQVITLDGYLSTHQIDKVKAAKIDIEGAELLALRGGQKWLTGPAAPEIIALEAIAAHAAALNITLDMLAGFLSLCGYSLHWLDETDVHHPSLISIGPSQPELPEGTWIALKRC